MQRHASARVRPSCFRTNHDGDILLAGGWCALLAHLREWGEWYLQTRHPYARLIARTRLPDWDLSGAAGALLRDPRGSLHARTDRWLQAVLRLEVCDCCDSPGYFEVRNGKGQPCLELRAPRERGVAELMAIAQEYGVFCSVAPSRKAGPALMPRAQGGAGPRLMPEALEPLLGQVVERGLGLEWRLLTHEAEHRRRFEPRTVTVEAGLLTVSASDGHSCQVLRDCVEGLWLERAEGGLRVQLVAGDGSLLLTFGAGSDEEQGARWEALLAAFVDEFSL